MATVSEVKLLGWWPSPFLMRPKIALNLRGVEYEFMPETFGTKSELLLESNPLYKRIPVLIHNGAPLCESMIIVQYIDDVWNTVNSQPILPSDPYQAALARFLVTYIDDKWFPALRNILFGETEAAKAESREFVFGGLQLFEEAFKKCKGKFFGGENIGYLDIGLGSYLGWVRATEKATGIKLLDEGKTPLLVRWADCFCAHSAVKEVMPDTQKLIDFANEYIFRSIAAK